MHLLTGVQIRSFAAIRAFVTSAFEREAGEFCWPGLDHTLSTGGKNQERVVPKMEVAVVGTT